MIELDPVASINGESTASSILKTVGHNGFPNSIRLDQHPVFISKMIKQLHEYLQIRQNFTISYRPETNG